MLRFLFFECHLQFDNYYIRCDLVLLSFKPKHFLIVILIVIVIVIY